MGVAGGLGVFSAFEDLGGIDDEATGGAVFADIDKDVLGLVSEGFTEAAGVPLYSQACPLPNHSLPSLLVPHDNE